MCMGLIVECSTYPCSFVSCEQRSVEHPLSNLCLCQRRSDDVADCVVRVMPLPQHQHQRRRRQVTYSACLRPRSACDRVAGRRRQRRTAPCRGQCGHHVRRAVTSTGRRCRNGGTPGGPSAVCQCRNGFFGDLCQLRDPCSEQPCRNGGYCRSLVDLTGLFQILA